MPAWVFLRHGESVANQEGWLSGIVDTPLTPLGREQAREAGRALADVSMDRAYCSDLSRAVDTAGLVLEGRGLEARQCVGLRERNLGDWAHRLLADLRESGENQVILGWDSAPPGGESLADVATRTLGCLASLPDFEGDTLVVAHGAVLRVVLGAIDGIDLASQATWRIPNAQPLIRELPVGYFRDRLALLASPRSEDE